MSRIRPEFFKKRVLSYEVKCTEVKKSRNLTLSSKRRQWPKRTKGTHPQPMSPPHRCLYLHCCTQHWNEREESAAGGIEPPLRYWQTPRRVLMKPTRRRNQPLSMKRTRGEENEITIKLTLLNTPLVHAYAALKCGAWLHETHASGSEENILQIS
jgi:hypothetical protein